MNARSTTAQRSAHLWCGRGCSSTSFNLTRPFSQRAWKYQGLSGVLGYWGIGVLGYWGIAVLGYWVLTLGFTQFVSGKKPSLDGLNDTGWKPMLLFYSTQEAALIQAATILHSPNTRSPVPQCETLLSALAAAITLPSPRFRLNSSNAIP
jgi:hypothetical protein